MTTTKRTIFFALLQVLALWLCVRPAAAQTYTCKEVMIPMRDGVKLATDVYVPLTQGTGPFPVVIERTPYSKQNCSNMNAQFFAKRGYVAIIQDERGRFNSEGTYYWMRDEAWGKNQDGYDTIEWAGTQPWSNGKVGTMGTSFTCRNQYLTAPTKPPHLAAMFCAMSDANAYKELFYTGGAIHMIMPTWLLTDLEMAQPLRMNFPSVHGYLGTVPAWMNWYQRKTTDDESFSDSMITDMLTDELNHPNYDDYWRQFAIDEHWSEIDVPTYHFSGWYDRYPYSAVRNFNGIQKIGGEHARNSQKLFLGPWVHGTTEVMPRVVGDMDFGQEAAIDYNALRVRWFDYWLKGIDNGIMKEPPVSIFVMGDNKWRQEHEFPLARQIATDYFLASGPSRSISSLNDGVLTIEPPSSNKPDPYRYDPRDPVPSIGGDLFIQPNGARDHRQADARSMTYTTAPLPEDMEITGLPKVDFYASSSAVDTDWVVTITDVYPNGYSQILRENILRARFRDGFQKPVLLAPDKIYEYVIEMYAISNVFKQGHRIRLSITSSSFPKWYPNGNTGRANDADKPTIVATNTIYHDREHPSRISLPVIPRTMGSASGGR